MFKVYIYVILAKNNDISHDTAPLRPASIDTICFLQFKMALKIGDTVNDVKDIFWLILVLSLWMEEEQLLPGR